MLIEDGDAHSLKTLLEKSRAEDPMRGPFRRVGPGCVLRRRGPVACLWAVWMLIASPLSAQSATPPRAAASLMRDLNKSIEELTRGVSMSVVQVLVAGYGPVDERTRGGESGLVIGRRGASGRARSSIPTATSSPTRMSLPAPGNGRTRSRAVGSGGSREECDLYARNRRHRRWGRHGGAVA